MEEILLDEFGYKQFLDELEKLKQISIRSASIGNEAYNDAVGDGWHDNFAFEESMRESRAIAIKIDNMLNEEKYIKIIASEKKDNELINIGDTVEVKIAYADDDVEIEKLTLTGKYRPNTDLDIKEISLNSPIGKAIYLQRVKSTVSYLVNGNKIDITILKKINN